MDDQSQPKILSLRHIIDEYLKFQEEVILRRTRYDLKKAQERAHLLEGLLIAQDNIDEVIRIIRSSYDNAKENLMTRFGLDDVQAQAILDMRLKACRGWTGRSWRRSTRSWRSGSPTSTGSSATRASSSRC